VGFEVNTYVMTKHKKTRIGTSLFLAFGLGLTTLGACTINIGTESMAPDRPSAAQGSEYSQQDLMFAQMMIPHHDQALEMSGIALENSTNQDVRDLAQRIYDGQGPEIEQMRSWLENSSTSSGMTHEMADGTTMNNDMMGDNMMDSSTMAGMASDDSLAELASLSSPEFDILFLQLMMEHHEGALSMVSMIESSPSEEAKELASEISSTQRAEIEEMSALLRSLTSS
jgi:uncharacterized protein (DUF305 family)